jgi:hypothetical protein
MAGVADEGERDALGRVDKGANLSHALKGERAVGLGAAGAGVRHNVHLDGRKVLLSQYQKIHMVSVLSKLFFEASCLERKKKFERENFHEIPGVLTVAIHTALTYIKYDYCPEIGFVARVHIL